MSELLNLLSFTAEQAHKLTTQSVTEQPIVIGGVTVIPVSKLSCGFTGGGSEKKNRADGVAAGAGVKITKTPLSFLAVCGQEVRILQVPEEVVKKNGLVGALTPLAEMLKDKFLKKEETTNPDPSED